MESTLSILKALADRNRLRLVMALSRHDELCACQLTELLQVAGATASRHLAALVQSGLVASRKEGRWVYYRLQREGIGQAVLDWLENALKKSPDVKTDERALRQIVACDPEDLCRRQRGETCCP